MKKTLSMFLAMVMAFALTIPAFAQQDDPSTKNVAVAGKVAAPTINVEVPSDVTLTLNPYQMKYNGEIKALKDKTDQILSVPAVFVNKTDGKLNAELTATATLPTGVTIASSSATAETTKKVYLTMQFGMVTDKTGASWDGTTPTAYAFETSNNATKVEYKKDATGTDPKALEIAATDGKTANYFAFSFGGDMSKDLASGTWAAGDAISVAVVLKLSPVNDAPQQQQQQNQQGGGN